tara:strand:+ start:182 stop:793 length:612 start_codon:yes stop_codon:yes gene_type:complete
MKKCTKCKVDKEITCFGKRADNNDGLMYHCKECRKESKKEYRKKNKDKIKEYHKEHYKANKDKRKERQKEYRKENKDKINKSSKEYQKNRRLSDPLYKMKSNLRTRTSQAFKNKGYSKNTKTQEMLGVDWEIAKKHLERQFTKGMNWSNQGDWHIDHIIPLSSANTEERLKKLCHYTNLQPLWAVDNLIKSDVINGQQNKFRF